MMKCNVIFVTRHDNRVVEKDMFMLHVYQTTQIEKVTVFKFSAEKDYERGQSTEINNQSLP